jgi:uncharacterized beta-barrel protein YwiB (DUF1934 family)
MPNYEYEPRIDEGFIPNAILKIKSVQFDASEGEESLFDAFFETLNIENGIKNNTPEKSGEDWEMISECVLCRENGRLDIRYKECAEGLPSWITSVSFQENEPGIVSIIRSGQLSHSFVIEQGVRHYSVYTTPYGPLEMCVYGRKVINNMTDEGGTIRLDYAVELKGMTAQRTKMIIEVARK